MLSYATSTGPVLSYKSRYIVGFWLVEMAISTNEPPIYRNLYENTGIRWWSTVDNSHKTIRSNVMYTDVQRQKAVTAYL